MDREINGVVGDTANAIQYIGDNLIGYFQCFIYRQR